MNNCDEPLILLPTDEGFLEILQNAPPPGWKQSVSIDDGNIYMMPDPETGELKAGNRKAFKEYVHGGAYDYYYDWVIL